MPNGCVACGKKMKTSAKQEKIIRQKRQRGAPTQQDGQAWWAWLTSVGKGMEEYARSGLSCR